MTSQGATARSGLMKAVLVVWLLAGVFAMHGLTGNHEVAMAKTHDAQPAMPMAHESHSAAITTPDAIPTDVTVEGASDGHGHAMGDVCLAMLTVLALAILGALAWRSLRAAHPVVWLRREPQFVAAGPAPPWAQPTLSRLCVLRT